MTDYTGVDQDERIHMLDRGMGRDIGRNPTFHGQKPVTRTERKGAPGESVGGYGTRDEVVTSFAATAIAVSAISQTLAVGSSALKGFSFMAKDGAAEIQLKVGGVVVWAGKLAVDQTVTQFFGDHGIGGNGVSLVVLSGLTLVGSVWVASTE